MSNARSPRADVSITVGTRYCATIELHNTCNRRVAQEEAPPMPTVEREIELDAPTDVVWRALTDADELSDWFGADVAGDLVADGAAAIGDRLALLTDADPDGGRLGFRWVD